MKLCSCGQAMMRTPRGALVCSHCDSPRAHATAVCVRCKTIGVTKS